jgi:glycosyltransferase involved in cell wall biosynthesis
VVVADSECTKKDLQELYGLGSDRVRVIYPGVESRFQPIKDAETLQKVRAKYELPECFVLGLSTLQPRKNFKGLVEGFRRLVADEGPALSADKELCLVVAGGEGWMYEETFAAVARSGLENRVRFTGFVEDADLPALYTLARAFAFPSWYEGFGLPVLESMACGTPVVTADNSSLPEVVGEAGLLVDAADPGALAGALGRILSDSTLSVRLAALGLTRAQQFRWTRAAEDLQQVYQNTLSLSSRTANKN